MESHQVEITPKLQRAKSQSQDLQVDKTRFELRRQTLLAQAGIQPPGQGTDSNTAAAMYAAQLRSLERGGDGSLEPMEEASRKATV